ncbi:MAG: acyl-CoA dehydrogenase, partial [Pseudomonadota bacterium]
EEYRKIQDLVAKFVADELLPLESIVCEREAQQGSGYLVREEWSAIDSRARELGLFGLDAPESVGGSDLSNLALTCVNEEIGYSAVYYELPPNSANLRILLEEGSDIQRDKYLKPLASGEMSTAIMVSEPGAGGDPSGMKTSAQQDGDVWTINGRKIWISNARDANFYFVFAVTGKNERGKSEVTAFIVDKDTPGITIERDVSMIAGWKTYEVAFDDCRVGTNSILGKVGSGWTPLQKRLESRRLEIAAWSIGAARRALDMMVEYAPSRVTFGAALADRQSIQWWITEARTQIHACRLMCQHAAWSLDNGLDVSNEVSLLKVHATEMAGTVIDHAMQVYGAMGVSKETPLYLLAQQQRLARIYEGPSEVHISRVARNIFAGKF